MYIAPLSPPLSLLLSLSLSLLDTTEFRLSDAIITGLTDEVVALRLRRQLCYQLHWSHCSTFFLFLFNLYIIPT